MKRSLASQILDRGRSNGCAHNFANDGEKRGPNDTHDDPFARPRHVLSIAEGTKPTNVINLR